MGVLTLVTGGARSGKSAFAESLAAGGRQPVLYLATATVEDDEMRTRVERHRARRPPDWRTVEAPTRVAAALAGQDRVGTVLLDDLGLLVANLLFQLTAGADPTSDTADQLETAVVDELDALCRAQAEHAWDLVVVTNEAGLGIVPPSPVGRIFRDTLGRANQALGARAEAVYLLVAGIPLRIKPNP